MRSPWESSFPRSDHQGDRGLDRGDYQVSLGRFIERSTSAPPLSSEPGFNLLASRDPTSSLFGRGTARAGSEQGTMSTLYENSRSRGEDDYSRLYPGNGGGRRENEAYSAQHDISSFLPDNLAGESSSSRPFDIGAGAAAASEKTYGGRGDRNILRSQSATPPLHGRNTIGPPPGLMQRKNSDRATRDNSSVDVNENNIMQLGQQRPASTGIIGDQNNVYSSSSPARSLLGLDSGGGAVRPAAKTLMDLIQEETPHQEDSFVKSYPRVQSYSGRSRSASPHPVPHHIGDEHQFTYTQSQRPYSDPYTQTQRQQQPETRDRVQAQPTETRERVQIRPRESYDQRGSQRVTEQERHRTTPQQYIAVLDQNGGTQLLPADGRVQGSIYAPVAPLQQPEQQQPYFGAGGNRQPQQQHVQQPVEVQTHIQSPLIPSQVELQAPGGQTVYVNPPAHPYGYATVQYHSPQVIRQAVPGRAHVGEQFVSVVPIQGGAAQLTGIQAAGGTFAYYHPDVAGGATMLPAVTLLNGPGQGAPIAVARIGNTQLEVPHANNNFGGRAKERATKGRRSGSNSKRGGSDNKHSPHSVSSPLLEEFRATKNRDWTIRDISGHVVEFCQDQNGSRFIQQRLEIGDASEQNIVMNEVLLAIHRLRNDVFGNYVVQKLLEFGTPQMKADIRDTLQGEMLPLSLQMYGCRVVQKALESLGEDDLPRLLREFHHNVLSCIHDQNGNHVIQKCIEVMSTKAKKARENGEDEKADFLGKQIDCVVDDVLGNAASLSCHPYGCRVLQRILEHCVEEKKTAALNEISKCHKTLLDDQYGNYVIQHVLQFGRQSDRDSILQIVVNNGLLTLSKQKFASNVVEKLLKFGSAQHRRAIVKEMLKVVDETGIIKPAGSDGGTSVVLLMVRDAYANYVVQTTLDVVPESEEKKLLLEELNAHSAELRNYTFAKHIVTKLSSSP